MISDISESNVTQSKSMMKYSGIFKWNLTNYEKIQSLV